MFVVVKKTGVGSMERALENLNVISSKGFILDTTNFVCVHMRDR